MLLGPSGVGKTLLSKCLAKFMFGDEDAMIVMDMSEYMEKHNASRLVGAPPGYVGYEEGGQLTEKVRRRPYAVVLLDEIEKAHSDVFNMLLQIMEEGRLTDAFGRHIDFKNVILIMTSNVGANLLRSSGGLGFMKQSEEHSYEKMREMLMSEVERHFRPEFLNRLDEILIFNSLTREDLSSIIHIEMRKVRARLAEQGVEITLTPEAEKLLIERGHNVEYGARPLRRALERNIEDPLAEELLKGELKAGHLLEAYVEEGNLKFRKLEKAAAEKEE